MTESEHKPVFHSPAKEPKFCRCRPGHEYFYAGTIAQARAAREEHAGRTHPDWHMTTCFRPDRAPAE